MIGLATSEQSWFGSAFEYEIQQRCLQLQNEGVQSGDVVPFSAPTNPETVWTLHALIRLGATAFPYSPTATSEHIDFVKQSTMKATHPDTWLRLTTTGTTGAPKPIDLRRTQIEASARASKNRIGHSPNDQWLCCLPLHHVAGLSILLRTFMYETTVVLHEGFDPSKVSNSIDDGGVNIISLVPTMLGQLLDIRKDHPFPKTLRTILLGGAPCTPSLITRCRNIQAPVSLTWGMTETASQIATRAPGDLRADPDVGHPLDGVTVHVQNGRLVVRGPIAPNGELSTDDRGVLDALGRVIVHGRGNDLIISGGENIDPRRIEDVLNRHPNVDECAVVGRSDGHWGQRPVAFIVGHEPEKLWEWVSHTLHRHEQPAEMHLVTELPRNELGKIDRKHLVDQAQSLHRKTERFRN